eukprot:CAMPEP_0181306864 /NCGR_PEP_ID=MMETSP1101-20121128/10545_1 /TAXON_ID=46948 /ORGANISM="Rhodomonas abbreviata, Strain Caron Lab Isolate" /LENGTH=249 /DNA_ID=CAMNT_0023412985 /DNA_START=59 /DNA_END=808 /DNA_ORIENTATION=+
MNHVERIAKEGKDGKGYVRTRRGSLESMMRMIGFHGGGNPEYVPNKLPHRLASPDPFVPPSHTPEEHHILSRQHEPEPDESNIMKFKGTSSAADPQSPRIKSGSLLLHQTVRGLGGRQWIRVSVEVFSNGTCRIYQNVPSIDMTINLDGCVVQDCQTLLPPHQRHWIIKIFAFRGQGGLIKKATLKGDNLTEKESWLSALRGNATGSHPKSVDDVFPEYALDGSTGHCIRTSPSGTPQFFGRCSSAPNP